MPHPSPLWESGTTRVTSQGVFNPGRLSGSCPRPCNPEPVQKGHETRASSLPPRSTHPGRASVARTACLHFECPAPASVVEGVGEDRLKG